MPYNSEENACTYYSAGELRKIEQYAKEGKTPAEIAYLTRRSISAIRQTLGSIRRANLMYKGGESDTLMDTKKDPYFIQKKSPKKDMPVKVAKAKSAVKFIKTGRS